MCSFIWLKADKKDLIFLLPFIFYLIIFIPFWGQAPALDPMINFRESTQLFSGGYKEIIMYGAHIHPPLLYSTIVSSLFVFGKSPGSYNLLGTILFLLSSFFLYFSVKHTYNRKVAIVFTLLLFSNPIVMLNFFYLANEILILFATLFAVFAYVYNKRLLFTILLISLALMKETAMVIVGVLFVLSMLALIKEKTTHKQKLHKAALLCISFSLPVLVFFGWQQYTKLLGTTEWRDTTFVKNGESSFNVVKDNILGFKLFNTFLSGNSYNALIFNFQWLYSALLLILSPLLFRRQVREKFFHSHTKKIVFLFILCTGLAYILFVLSFPTWTEPRYSIPVFGLFYFLLSLELGLLPKKVFYLIFSLLFLLAILRNVVSLDPVSSQKGMVNVYGTTVYNKDFWNDGPDGIEYNMQHLWAVKTQNNMIKKAMSENADAIVSNCYLLKLGERIWSISVHNNFYPGYSYSKPLTCVNNFELNTASAQTQLTNKVIFIPQDERNTTLSLIRKNNIPIKKIVD